MKFTPTPLHGVFVVELERIEDERGFFARSYCAKEFAAQGLCAEFPQCSVSFNRKAGTLRGMHWQAAPQAEDKLVRCTRGAIYDVALDLRPDSPSHLRWFAAELSANNHRALYIPQGCAHGFQTLRDDSEVYYQISVPYEPGSARGARWDDPAFGIEWPAASRIIAAKDRQYPDYRT